MPHDATIDAIAEFLRAVGLEVLEGPVPEDAFLPGLAISEGRLVFDRARLRWPGDLLHEAGHLAVTPGAQRLSLSDGVASMGPQHGGEVESIAWSYAAVLDMGLDPAVLFHEGGYHGRSQALLLGFSLGVYPGAAGLEAFGMTACGAKAVEAGVAPYPHMLRWLRA